MMTPTEYYAWNVLMVLGFLVAFAIPVVVARLL